MAFDLSLSPTDAAVYDGNLSGRYSAMDCVDPETPETILGEAETAKILGSAFGGLTPEHQQVIYLYVSECMSFADIAAHLGISKQSAHERYQLAIQRLRVSLAIMGINDRTGFAA
jgi:RNA polymerase sigma factor (sigma-70 family)